ncbi:MAG: CRISPR-associated endonuclease Cas2 [Candidatus Delongbacteria bacterium]|jgi:CRISPR-associated protein Cas2|nr:CRISPR-associated endonuclease Cas2 [Candidatus Delongbacteria bacterium]
MYMILIYDIQTITKSGQRRMQKIFKLCKKYLHHIQKSVFEGEVTESKYYELKLAIENLINAETDSVIFFKSRDEKWLKKELIGIQEDKTDNFI